MENQKENTTKNTQTNQVQQPDQSQRASQPVESQQDFQDQEVQQEQYDTYLPEFSRPIQEQLVFEWKAPSRPFKKRKRQYFTTITTIGLLLCLILFFAGQVLTVAVVIAVAFLSYIMATIPPHTVNNAITTFGIRNEENLYYWEELGRFWFEKKHDDMVLYIEVGRFPFRLALLLGSESQELLTEILSEVLINEKPPLTETEKMTKWLQEKIPLDIDS